MLMCRNALRKGGAPVVRTRGTDIPTSHAAEATSRAVAGRETMAQKGGTMAQEADVAHIQVNVSRESCAAVKRLDMVGYPARS